METDKILYQYKIWLTSPDGEGIMGNGKLRLLKTIDQLKSIRAAAIHLNISYRKAWGDLRSLEQLLDTKMLNKVRGGATGGNSLLTEDAKKLVKAFDQLNKNVEKLLKKEYIKFQEMLK